MNGMTELVFILDRSGSMFGLESDTIGGFNAMLEKQKKAEGTVLLSTILFNQESVVLHDRVNVLDVPALTASARSIATSGRKMCPITCFSSSPRTAWKTPAVAIPRAT